MDQDFLKNSKDNGQIEILEYILKENDLLRTKIYSELNLTDIQSKIFEILCEIARDLSDIKENKINFTAAWKKVFIYGQKNLIRELHSEINAKANTLEVIKKLCDFKYCKLEKGTIQEPEIFFFTKPTSFKLTEEDKEVYHIKEILKEFVEKKLNDLKRTNKLFPTKYKAFQIVEIQNPNVFLNEKNIKKAIRKINSNEFTDTFIKNKSGTHDLIEVIFDDTSSILLSADSLIDLVHNILPVRIKTNLKEDIILKEKINIMYSKKNKKAPSVESIFTDEITESSFEWINTYYEILKEQSERMKGKKVNYNFRFFFQSASLLYYYFLSKRETFLKNKAFEYQKIKESKQLEKQLIDKYEQPWDSTKILTFLNSITSLKKKYTEEDISWMIDKINEPAIKVNKIPNILSIKIANTIYYFHKFRFVLFFFNQQNIESIRLKSYYLEKWSQAISTIPSDERKFEEDIKSNINKLFFVLLEKVIPYIFRYNNPHAQLIPNEISKDDKIALEKFKEEYNLFIRSVFVKKNIMSIKPLPQLLDLNLNEIKKNIVKEKAKSFPFYKKIFSWFFKLIEFLFTNDIVKEKMRQDVLNAQIYGDPISGLTDLIKVYKNKEDITTSQMNYLRKIINKAKKTVREKQRLIKEKEKIKKEERSNLKKKQIITIKEYFLEGESLEEKLEEYSKKCFMKFDQARKDSEESIKDAINAYLRNHRGKTIFDIESIKIYARAIVQNNKHIFSEIRDQESLTKYIELLLLKAFLHKMEK